MQKINNELALVEERLTSGLQQTAADSVLNAIDPGTAFLTAPVDVQKGIIRVIGLTITIRRAAYEAIQLSSERIEIAEAGALG